MGLHPAWASGLVFVGAGLGANARYWLGGWVAEKYGVTFPWGTLCVNVIGSILIGLFMQIALREAWAEEWRLLVAIGLLGGFTTFSSFSYETLRLVQTGSFGLAAWNAAASLALCLVGCWIGLAAGKAVAGP